MDSSRIHLAEVPPAFCAACYSAKPQLRHVDFGAAYEGPTFAASDMEHPVVGGLVVTVDDLIVCEECLALAAKVIGLGDATELTTQLEDAQATIDRLSDQLAKQAEYSASLEQTLAARPQAHGPATVDAGSARSAGPPPSNRKRRAPSR